MTAQDDANAELRRQLGPAPPATAKGTDEGDMARRMTPEEQREWIREAERVETEDQHRAMGAGLAAGFIAGAVVVLLLAWVLGWVGRTVDTPKPRIVERTIVEQAPVQTGPPSELLYEARVPVCLEDERAVGVGDYKGVMSGGWARWRCVHVDELHDALGL